MAVAVTAATAVAVAVVVVVILFAAARLRTCSQWLHGRCLANRKALGLLHEGWAFFGPALPMASACVPLAFNFNTLSLTAVPSSKVPWGRAPWEHCSQGAGAE